MVRGKFQQSPHAHTSQVIDFLPLLSIRDNTAAEAFTTALRFELEGWGIRVVTINPTYHRTEMGSQGGRTLTESFDRLDAKTREEYGAEYIKNAQALAAKNNVKCWDPRHAVNALIKATTAIEPRTQYIVGSDAIFSLLPLMNYPTPMVEKMITRSALQDFVPACEKSARALRREQEHQQDSKRD